MSDELSRMPPLDDDGKGDLAQMLAQRAPKGRSKVTTTLVVVLVLLVGVFLGVPIGRATSSSAGGPGAGGFPGAPASGASAANSTGGDTAGGQGAMPGGPQAGGFPGRGTAGTVKSVDGGTLVVTTTDGTEVTVATSEQTAITESTAVAVDQLTAGTKIVVMGEQADDGTVAAQRIIVGDAGFGGAGGQGPGAAPSGPAQ